MNPQHIVYLSLILVGLGVTISAIDPLKPETININDYEIDPSYASADNTGLDNLWQNQGYRIANWTTTNIPDVATITDKYPDGVILSK